MLITSELALPILEVACVYVDHHGVKMPIKDINAETAKTWLEAQEAILLDVREPSEHAAQKISGSELKPLGALACSELPATDTKILIHCQQGGRGKQACEKLLAENPSLDVYNIEGGIEAWKQAGLPIECSGKKTLPLDRQVQLTVGVSVLVFSVLAYAIHPAFALGSAFFGAGLANAGLTGWCGLARLLARMPWNKA